VARASGLWRRGLAGSAGWLGLLGLGAVLAVSCRVKPAPQLEAPELAAPAVEFASGISYTNYLLAQGPWSIHVVRVDRSDPDLQVLSTHAREGVGELSTLSDQIKALKPEHGFPLAGVNGDYFARDRSVYAGDVRGLQIVDGVLSSAPVGGAAFWLDAKGGYHATNVVPRFLVVWPAGSSWLFGVNRARHRDAVLYTPSMGATTRTTGGRELVLESAGEGPWLPLQIGENFTARVREVRETGNTPLVGPIMVLSLDPAVIRLAPAVRPGALLRFSTDTVPDLRGTKTAISGGPVLVRDGRLQPIRLPRNAEALPYTLRTMQERHPRTAIGWDNRHFFLIQVDGRQPWLSVGMTLEELGGFALYQLGCQQAMNLDGGASSTLWADGQVRNSPCARGMEAPVANALVVVRRKGAALAREKGTEN
jgi:hypothetical protein